MDGVNRDIKFEREFYHYRKSPKGDSTRMDALWSVWYTLKLKDLKPMRIGHYRTILSCLKLADLHFRMAKEELPYFEYVKWFAFNRIPNGHDGIAKCQKSPLFMSHEEGAVKDFKKQTSK